jgi:hypothetical protein
VKLWLDDLRPAPPGWTWAKSSARAIALLESGEVTEASLDHDLGMDGATETAGGVLMPAGAMNHSGCGYDVAAWIEQAAHEGRLGPLSARCHSANPVGRQRIEAALASARRAWGAAS